MKLLAAAVAGLDLAIHPLSKRMDPRVTPVPDQRHRNILWDLCILYCDTVTGIRSVLAGRNERSNTSPAVGTRGNS